MGTVNLVILTGRLGQDPELKQTKNGTSFCNLSVATEDTRDKKTQWHRVEVWKQQAEFAARYAQKGSIVHVEGRLAYEHWEDNKGVRHDMTKVKAEKFVLIAGSKPKQEQLKVVEGEPEEDI